MRTLPDPFLAQPMVKRVYNWYLASFREMILFPSLMSTDNEDIHKYSARFADLISSILRRHAPTVMTIALVRGRRWWGRDAGNGNVSE